MEFTANAVKAGSDVKGDLLVTLELAGNTRKIEIESKVAKKFGPAIREDVNLMLDKYKIAGAKVFVQDLSALDFAVKARVETAIKRTLAKQEAAK
ncbi:MAG: citrate lyase acyl carrier protein [Acidaminococcaceae bacterium]|jgi:citrate lyase subunit gamma (acyl carrier protein)|nr:citrate lyase acyl carrier protein [Acidaminococcaceae bacterium]